MAILTLVANPAARSDGFTTEALSIGGGNIRRRVEVKTVADCTAAFDAFVKAITESGEAAEVAKRFATSRPTEQRGAACSAFIHNGDGRKPNGYSSLKLRGFIALAEQVAA